MRRISSATAILSTALGVSLLLGGCVQSRLRDQADFGESVRQDRAAQIADPDAHYAGVPGPGSNGLRVDAAQERYVKGAVIQPAQTQTSSVSAGGNGSSAQPSAPSSPTSGQ
jgi:hypothetical protein